MRAYGKTILIWVSDPKTKGREGNVHVTLASHVSMCICTYIRTKVSKCLCTQ